jgi:putative transposase
MYEYRRMTAEQRHEAVVYLRLRERPWHSPPHWEFAGDLQFMISGACYEHVPIIGMNHQRMSDCEESLLTLCAEFATALYAWCVLPNHYHLLLRTDCLNQLRAELGKFHGRTSFTCNGEDSSRGRKVWHNCLDRGIKSHGHFWASMNYIHNNPVHHGYVARWQDWPWSSAAQWLDRVGHDTAAKIWREYPPLDYGKTWDFD